MGSKGCVNGSVLPRNVTDTSLNFLVNIVRPFLIFFLITLLMVKLMFAGMACSSFLYGR